MDPAEGGGSHSYFDGVRSLRRLRRPAGEHFATWARYGTKISDQVRLKPTLALEDLD